MPIIDNDSFADAMNLIAGNRFDVTRFVNAVANGRTMDRSKEMLTAAKEMQYRLNRASSILAKVIEVEDKQ